MKNYKKNLMAQLVLGYPSVENNWQVVEAMAKAQVKYIELQIPFSDPIADGPVIVKANQISLENGTKVSDCFKFAKKVVDSYPEIKFLFMSYYNILFSYGVAKFIEKAAEMDLYGLIVPDLPLEEDQEHFYKTSNEYGLKPIAVVSPTISQERLKLIKNVSQGFIYATSKVGITGSSKRQNNSFKNFIVNLKKNINLPVAIGFGIDSVEKAKEISKLSDIIVIGSKIIKLVDLYPQEYKSKIYYFLSKILANINKN